MFENIIRFLKKLVKSNDENAQNSKNAAKERLHLVLIQDRASVSADFLEVMKQEIIEVIKKYIDIDESAIDVRLTNNTREDGTVGAPALYANFPITNVKVKSPEIENNDKQEHTSEVQTKDSENDDKKEKLKKVKNKTEEPVNSDNQPEIEIKKAASEIIEANNQSEGDE